MFEDEIRWFKSIKSVKDVPYDKKWRYYTFGQHLEDCAACKERFDNLDNESGR